MTARAAPPVDPDPKEVFASCSFADVWADAGMPECLRYLKGNQYLQIPPEWRVLLPTSL